jgi:MYXO-CTERM domain-containing protein
MFSGSKARFVVGLAMLVAPRLVLANPGGITGYSGKSGATCKNCHAGTGGTTTVVFAGPATLNPGEVGTYTFTVTGGAAVQGGVDIAVDSASATLATTDPNLHVDTNEVTHSAPIQFTTGTGGPQLQATFKLTAPSTAGTLTLYGAGLSSEKTTAAGGNFDAKKYTVTVGGGGTSAGTTGGTTGGTTAGGTTAGGTTSGTNGGTNAGGTTGGTTGGVYPPVDLGSSPHADGGTGASTGDSGSGCSMGGQGVDAGLLMIPLFALCAFAFRRRRA